MKKISKYSKLRVEPLQPNSTDLVLSLPKVMSALSCSYWTVYALIKRGKLRAAKQGKGFVVTRPDLDRYVQSISGRPE